MRGNCNCVYLDDGAGERICDDVEQVGGILSALDVKGFDHAVSEFVQDPRGNLQREQNQHRQPVEEVMDRRASKRPVKTQAQLKTLRSA